MANGGSEFRVIWEIPNSILGGNDMRNKNATNSILFCCAIAVLLVAGPAAADVTTFSAQLLGGNEIPPVVTSASGLASVIVVTDDNGQNVSTTWTVEFSGLSSAQTGAGFYDGSPAENGDLWFDIPLGSPQSGPLVVDLLHAIEFGYMAGNPGAVGNIYVNISTEDHPEGEIRGNFVLLSVVSNEDTTWGVIKALFR